MPESVTLTWIEMTLAANCGVMRRIKSMRDGSKSLHGIDPEDYWRADISGAIGECALAKYLGVFWCGTIDTFSLPDVGEVHVRTSTRQNGRLIHRMRDSADGIYAQVNGIGPTFYIMGWAYGRDARELGKLCDYNGREPAWFLDNDLLTAPGTLKARIIA